MTDSSCGKDRLRTPLVMWVLSFITLIRKESIKDILLLSRAIFFHKGDRGPYWRSGLPGGRSSLMEFMREERLKMFVEEMALMLRSCTIGSWVK